MQSQIKTKAWILEQTVLSLAHKGKGGKTLHLEACYSNICDSLLCLPSQTIKIRLNQSLIRMLVLKAKQESAISQRCVLVVLNFVQSLSKFLDIPFTQFN